jgi:predicted metalloprotease with PDZ domain
MVFLKPIPTEISFENAIHHEAQINVSFPNITSDTLVVQSRTSPGRYAIHEFAKECICVQSNG